VQVDKTINPDSIGRERSKNQVEKQILIIQSQTSFTEKQFKSTMYGLNDHYNPLFKLSIDLYSSDPLLGC